jgi:hypothetical protein
VVIKRIKELELNDKAEVYNLLYKSLKGSISYVTFSKDNLILSII